MPALLRSRWDRFGTNNLLFVPYKEYKLAISLKLDLQDVASGIEI